MLALEIVVILGVAVLVSSVAARRWRVVPPVLLLAVGSLLGLLPALRGVGLPPEAVLLLFLPALLYWESLTTSLREIRTNLRVIVLLSTVLVIATAAAVAAVAHALGLAWGPAWVLGAAVAPTDATAVAVLARLLPRRIVTILRAESLVNDGTALVIYGLAVGITVGEEHLGGLHVTWLFVLAYGGGALAGLAVAGLAVLARRHLREPTHENVVSVLTPFSAFLLAELAHASGVVAVVVAGLALSQLGPRVIGAETRQQAQGFWTLTTFLLNGALFVLVGLQLPASVRELTSVGLTRALVAVALISATVIGTRFAWNFTTPYLLRALDRRPQQRLRRVPARTRVVSATAGFRGAVSLAAALAVPETLRTGAPFPARDTIIFVVSGVIVVTLVAQGLALPAVLRWARLPADTSVERERRLAETAATEEALAALPEVAARLGVAGEPLERIRAEYEEHLQLLRAQEGTEDERVRHAADYAALRLELLGRKRATLLRLRHERRIDDVVLRQIQARLDIEEVRLARREPVE
ncbi:Na+/H+ antiporter [Micromonospora sp. NPDC049559]|uniref:Na+/H+ antiporter n=1 Tax=Micromonospora sp. NPDC049559 TaxID=3155923 RepID=UPI00343E66D0